MKVQTAIIGGSGYTGAELLRILADHPVFNVSVITGDSQAGGRVIDLYPHLASYRDNVFCKIEEVTAELANCELVFCGLPHGQAMVTLPQLKNKVIIDLGGDFRLDRAELYDSWYGFTHNAPAELKHWQYGLTELFRTDITKATRIANPGCYPTAATLGLAPLVKNSLIEGTIVVDAVSGTSGAGRVPKPNLHFSHGYEDVRAYKLGQHQHTPEMEMVLSRIGGKKVTVSFTPHLVPMVRGIHATCSSQICPSVSRADLVEALSAAYKAEPFVRVSKEPPGTKEVRGSNGVAIFVTIDQHAGRAIVTSVIDNLVKGAAGQAIQNANLIFGLEETLGLTSSGVYP